MELKAYLRILRAKWKLGLSILLLTYGATLAFTFTRQPVYQGRTTFIVKLNSSFSTDKDLAAAVDILSRRTEIANTYAIVASSRAIKRAAAEELGLTARQRGSVTVASQLIPGTNVVEIEVQAPDPVLARDFANTVGGKTAVYVEDLYETYKLEQLDQSSAPDTPIEPNKPLNLLLGAVIGLILGIGVIVLATYLQSPLPELTNTSIIDADSGVYTKSYFLQRLQQETSRLGRSNRPFSIALVNMDSGGVLKQAAPEVRADALRQAAQLLTSCLRVEDVAAHFEHLIVVVLLPEATEGEARETMEAVRARFAAPLELERSGVKVSLQLTAGIAELADGSTEPRVLLERAMRALEQSAADAGASTSPFAESRDAFSTV